MNKNNVPVVTIQPGHHLFTTYRSTTGEYVFSIEVTQNEHIPGTYAKLENEVTMPVFMMVIHSPEQAEIMADYLMGLSKRMKNDDKNETPKPNEVKVDKEHMTIREYNKLFGGNNND